MYFAWVVTLLSWLSVVVAFFWWQYPPFIGVRAPLVIGPLAVLLNQWFLSAHWSLDENLVMAFALLTATILGTIWVWCTPKALLLPLLGGYMGAFLTVAFWWPYTLIAVVVALLLHTLMFFYHTSKQLLMVIYSLCLAALVTWLGFYTERAYVVSDYQAIALPPYLIGVAVGVWGLRLFYLAQINYCQFSRYILLNDPSSDIQLATQDVAL